METLNEYNILMHSAWCKRTVTDLYSVVKSAGVGPCPGQKTQFPLLSWLCLCNRKYEVLCLFSEVKKTKVELNAVWEMCCFWDKVVIASCVITSFSRGVTECQISPSRVKVRSTGRALEQPHKPFGKTSLCERTVWLKDICCTTPDRWIIKKSWVFGFPLELLWVS